MKTTVRFQAPLAAIAKYLILAVGLLSGGLTAFTPQTFAQGGVPLWTNVYVGAGYEDKAYAIAVNSSGDVFVTGVSATTNECCHDNFATIKYSGAGVALWTNRYQGPGNFSDSALAVALDASGNVFVTGSSYGGGSGYDYATIKYSGAGAALWTNRYTGPGNWSDTSVAIAVDPSGNVFVTGYSTVVINNNGHFEYATIKYSSTGAALWTRRYTGLVNGDADASAIALDASGNVFVTGSSYGSGTSLDYATIKYASAGVALWTNRYTSPGSYSDRANAIAVDGSGNVFVAGGSFRSGNFSGYAVHDYATIKYSGDGVPLWTNRYNGPEDSDNVAVAVAVDGSGNVFVTGRSGYITFGGYAAGYDYATVKYSSAGVPLWTNRYDGPGNGNDYVGAVAVDGSGTAFVTGTSEGSGGTNDYATVAYSSAGVPLWTNRYNGPGNGDDVARGVAVDGGGNVFVTGYSIGSGGSYDYATIKYSPTVVPIHLAIEPDGSGGYFIRFNGGPGVTYRLQRAADLTGPWPAIATNTAPVSGLVEFHDATPLPGQAFYRTIQP